MKNLFHLLQINWNFHDYKFALLGFLTAFAVTLITIPPAIELFKKLGMFDMPGARKVHTMPIPTLGGITVIAGMSLALIFWFPFKNDPEQISYFFSLVVLTALGIMDDLKDLSARYKLLVQSALALLVTASGIRVTNFEGLFGLYQLPVFIQYSFTVLAIVGITNAFNLIDGIDGLAGSLGFMSLVTLGIFLGLNHNSNSALIAFALAGGVLAFLFFNYNPARIFMGDTGSLVLGFSIAILCIRLMQSNTNSIHPTLIHAPVFTLGIVLIPVFDTLRVFALRIWKGQSPFTADKTHIHHLLTSAGFSPTYTTRLICFIHGIILLEVFRMQQMKQELVLMALMLFMLIVTLLFKNLSEVRSGKKYSFFSLFKLFSRSIPDKE
ncbi:MAG TPA: MraY family glycosyltransferase [Chitinophagaceae bacterium]|jgi:UDP-N-acetylmuramyl pentapeptide phosphotransferase/UDP-N-acetylglucosamine-1-phosphate transferase|nr:MraY family glycosyltransferase [Chitinophagaceae bacterium]